MLLTRLSGYLREQNWLAVAIEFAIVMLGVVAGFQITAWNEGRMDRQKEFLIVERLRADFTEIEARTTQLVEGLETRAEYGNALADLAIHPADAVSREDFGQAVTQAIGTPVPAGRSATYVELLASGEMRLIRSEALRTALVRFDEQVRQQELAYETLADLVIGNAGILLEYQSLDAAATDGAPQRYIEALDAMRASPDLLAAARLMGMVNQFNRAWNTGTRDRARAVLEALPPAPNRN